MVKISSFYSALMEENAYLIEETSTGEMIAVDPNGSLYQFLLQQNSFKNTTWIINTHGHADHISYNNQFVDNCSAKIIIGFADQFLLGDSRQNFSFLFGKEITSKAADVLIRETTVLPWSGKQIQIIPVGGHSKGSLVIKVDKAVLVGDLISFDTYGITNFPDCDPLQCFKIVQNTIATTPSEYTIYPGHGQNRSCDWLKNSYNFSRTENELAVTARSYIKLLKEANIKNHHRLTNLFGNTDFFSTKPLESELGLRLLRQRFKIRALLRLYRAILESNK